MSEKQILFERLIENELYVSNFDKFDNDSYSEYTSLLEYLKDDYLNKLNELNANRSYDIISAYKKLNARVLIDLNLSSKEYINLLSNKDLLDNDGLYSIFCNIPTSLKIGYLYNKKICNETDVYLINRYISENNDKDFIKNILNCKLPNHSLYLINPVVNIEDEKQMDLLLPFCVTMNILKKINNFDEFDKYIKNNKNTLSNIKNHSINFLDKDNKKVINYLMSNPEYINKFNSRYLELINLDELNTSACLGDVLSIKYNKDNTIANKLFSENNLKKCDKNSITCYPFEFLSTQNKNNIFNNYGLFNRFENNIIIEAIMNEFSLDDKINILRNNNFINEMEAYSIELILNNLDFKTVFNMIQNKTIFNKINNINVHINKKDSILIRGYLDSPEIINKTNHNMIYNLLGELSSDIIIHYFSMPYIVNKLTNEEIINLAINYNLNVNTLLEIKDIEDRLSNDELIKYINNRWEYNYDISIFNNKHLIQKLFNIDNSTLDSSDLNEVNYLFETIKNKDFLTLQNAIPTVSQYSAVLASYITFGIKKTLDIINNGNKDITLDNVLKLKDIYIKNGINKYKSDNSSLLYNSTNKLINRINNINIEEKNDLYSIIVDEQYIIDLINLMVNSNYTSMNEFINFIYDSIMLRDKDNNDYYHYVDSYLDKFKEYLIKKEKDSLESIYDSKIYKNVEPKKDVLVREQSKLSKEYLTAKKVDILVDTLLSKDVNKNSYAFESDIDLNLLKETYMKFVGESELLFSNILHNILIPMSKNEFNIDECMSKLGYEKPANYEKYHKIKEDKELIADINKTLLRFKKVYNTPEIIEIMNYICYGTELSFRLSFANIKILNDYFMRCLTLSDEIYIDKIFNKVTYRDGIEIENSDELEFYDNNVAIIDNIIKRTNYFIKRNMIDNEIIDHNINEYFRKTKVNVSNKPITTHNYQIKERLYSLRDLESLFNGFDFSSYKGLDKNLEYLLFKDKSLYYYIEGYYDINNMGSIISQSKELNNLSKKLNITTNSIRNFNQLFIYQNINLNYLTKNINPKIINNMVNTTNTYDVDINDRISEINNNYETCIKRSESSIPYVNITSDNNIIRTIENHSDELINNDFPIGSNNYDYYKYCIENKNSSVININGNRAYIVRNGNMIFINPLDIINHDAFKTYANTLINDTKFTKEPIEIVTIVDKNNHYNGIEIDSSTYNMAENPINVNSDVYANRNIVIASSVPICKENFNNYYPTYYYRRNRNQPTILHNFINQNHINKIYGILYQFIKENEHEFVDLNINNYKEIIYGDDYVILIAEDNEIINYVLPYDKRALIEVECLLNNLTLNENNKKSIIK